jgi:type VI protein secretion system component VasK
LDEKIGKIGSRAFEGDGLMKKGKAMESTIAPPVCLRLVNGKLPWPSVAREYRRQTRQRMTPDMARKIERRAREKLRKRLADLLTF